MKSLSIIIIISSGTEENIVSEPRIHSKKMGMRIKKMEKEKYVMNILILHLYQNFVTIVTQVKVHCRQVNNISCSTVI